MHWEDPEGSGGEGGGRGDWDGEHMYIHGWFMSTYDKNHCNTKKNKKEKKGKKKSFLNVYNGKIKEIIPFQK